jgi:hypothetical protein
MKQLKGMLLQDRVSLFNTKYSEIFNNELNNDHDDPDFYLFDNVDTHIHNIMISLKEDI